MFIKINYCLLVGPSKMFSTKPRILSDGSWEMSLKIHGFFPDIPTKFSFKKYEFGQNIL